MKRLFYAVTLGVLAALTVYGASAQPPLPSSFYGYVALDNQNVATGTTIVAYAGGNPVAQTEVWRTPSGRSAYEINVPGDDPATTAVEGGTAGAQVFFVIGNTDVAYEIGTWATGTNVRLDLSAGTPTPTSITPTPGLGGMALPSSFYGTVRVDGANAAEGATVTAWIGGVQVATANTSAFQGNTVYRLVILSDEPNTAARIEGGVEGDTIILKIGDHEAQERATWRSGTNVELNLSASTAPSPSVALASIANQLVLVYLYDPSDPLLWKVYDPRAPAYVNTLERMERGKGYWIKVNAAATVVTGGISVNLSPGWNLVGWMG